MISSFPSFSEQYGVFLAFCRTFQSIYPNTIGQFKLKGYQKKRRFMNYKVLQEFFENQKILAKKLGQNSPMK